MKITKKHLLSLLVLFIIFSVQLFLIYNVSVAQASNNLWDTVRDGGLGKIGSEAYGSSDQPSQSVQEIVARIIAVFLGLLGLIFLILIILAGYKWMMAQGNEEKITEAKDQLKTGIIGLLIILGAYAIAHLVLNKIIFATTGTEPVW